MNKKSKNIYQNIYGLTGIMGSGKSTAGKLFQTLGAHVINADALAKSILDPNYHRYDDVLFQIKNQFGDSIDQIDYKKIFLDNKEPDRQEIARLVFSNKKLLRKFEKIIHPEVYDIFKQEIARINPQLIIIYDAPLLFEKKLDKKLRATILVYTPEELAIERAQHRTGLSQKSIKKRIQAQISIEKKKKIADYIIDNTGKLDNLVFQVESIWKKIKEEKE